MSDRIPMIYPFHGLLFILLQDPFYLFFFFFNFSELLPPLGLQYTWFVLL